MLTVMYSVTFALILSTVFHSAHWYLAIICYPGLVAPEMASRTISDDVGNLASDTSAKSDGKKVNEGKGRSRAKQENAEKTGRNDEASQVHLLSLLC